MSEHFISFAKKYLSHLNAVLDGIDQEEVAQFVDILFKAREEENSVFFIGNGGSAATSAHFANDLAIGTKQLEKPFRVFSLVDNIATTTAIGNDFGYEEIFARQIEVYGKSGDVLVAVSASGNSPNLVKAFEAAKNKNMKRVSITAFDGGKLKSLADHSVHVPTGLGEYGPAEDAHMILDHLITNYLQASLS
jgi:D-sedoheptulose 7-phosphate isomerase